MKALLILGLFGGLFVALPGFNSARTPAAASTAIAETGESLADAVVRINTEVQREYGVLSPTPLTVARLKSAIEHAAREVAKSDWDSRTSYVNTLTSIAAAGRIPETVHFCFTPIKAESNKKQKDEFRDGRHVAVSLNYTLLVLSNNGNRLIGLTQIVEVFQIIKPTEQVVPFQIPRTQIAG
jgi:hypothetical protein